MVLAYHRGSCTVFVAILFLFVSEISLTWADKFSFEIISENECFFVDAIREEKLLLKFTIIHGGDLSIGYVMTVPGGNNMSVTFSGSIKDQFTKEFPVYVSGTQKICFTNPKRGLKKLELEIVVQRPGDEHTHVDPLYNTVDKLYEELDYLLQTQKYLRHREELHRDTAEITNERVMWWSILESIALLAASVGQVVFLKYLTSKNSK